MVLLKRCELSLTKLAAYLDVTFPTLQRRVEAASEHADLQPSMFDATETIPPTFEPRSQLIRQLVKEHGSRPIVSWACHATRSLIDIGRQLVFALPHQDAATDRTP